MIHVHSELVLGGSHVVEDERGIARSRAYIEGAPGDGHIVCQAERPTDLCVTLNVQLSSRRSTSSDSYRSFEIGLTFHLKRRTQLGSPIDIELFVRAGIWVKAYPHVLSTHFENIHRLVGVIDSQNAIRRTCMLSQEAVRRAHQLKARHQFYRLPCQSSDGNADKTI